MAGAPGEELELLEGAWDDFIANNSELPDGDAGAEGHPQTDLAGDSELNALYARLGSATSEADKRAAATDILAWAFQTNS